MLGLGIFSLVQMGNIRQAGVVIEQVSVPSIKILDELTALNLRMRTLSYRLLLNREPETLRDTLALLDQRNAQIDRARQAYLPMIGAADEQAAFDQYGQLLNQYRQLESRMRSLSQADRTAELRDLLNRDLLANSEQVNKVMDTLVRINTDQTRATNEKAASQYAAAFALVIGLLVAATVLTFLCAFLLTRSIVKPIEEALKSAEQVADGDLTHVIRAEGTDEAARLLRAMARMQDKLRDTLQQIAGSAAIGLGGRRAECGHRRKCPRPAATEQRNRTSRHGRYGNDQCCGRSGAQCREHFRSVQRGQPLDRRWSRPGNGNGRRHRAHER